MPNRRLPAAFRLLLRALLGLGATAATVFGYAALLGLAVQAGQPVSGTWVSGTPEASARKDALEMPLQQDLRGRGREVGGDTVIP